MTPKKFAFCFRCSYNGELNYRNKKDIQNGRANVTIGAVVMTLITQFRCRQKQRSARPLDKSPKLEHAIKIVYVDLNTRNTMTHLTGSSTRLKYINRAYGGRELEIKGWGWGGSNIMTKICAV